VIERNPLATDLLLKPYRGLAPFREQDAEFFFGRDRERDVICANLIAWPLTLLYGPTGVGKSSVLQAGVLPHLRKQRRYDLDGNSSPESVVVVFNSWRDEPAPELARSLREATKAVLNEDLPNAESASRPLLQTLESWTTRRLGPMLIILDQFEEYFNYPSEGADAFGDQFARAVNRTDLQAHFLISIREDALARLDLFKGRISRLFDNYLRITHLSVTDAQEAIEGPIRTYNLAPENRLKQASVAPDLVAAVLTPLAADEYAPAQVSFEGVGRVMGRASRGPQVQMSYVQLVMSRLWDEERRLGSRSLRLETLDALGGVLRVVQAYVDDVLNNFSDDDRRVAARVFRYLVTPSGTKIAYTAADLQVYADVPAIEIEGVLKRLAGDIRIITKVGPSPRPPHADRYEIFHDVLGPAVLDWSRRQEELKSQDQVAARLKDTEQRIANEWARVAAQPGASRSRAPLIMTRMASALVEIAPIVPAVACLAAAFLYIALWPDFRAVLIGLAFAGLGWLATALLTRTNADSRGCEPHIYREVHQRIARLEAWDDGIGGDAMTAPHRYRPGYIFSVKEVRHFQEAATSELRSRGVQWAFRMGYVKVWELLHRAEEAFIEVAPRDVVVAEALDDERRLAGLDKEGALLIGQLRESVRLLNRMARAYLSQPGTAPQDSDAEAPDSDAQARATLRQIRRTLNEFRDATRAALVRARNRMLLGALISGIVLQGLLAAAVSADPPRDSIAGAAAFAVAGAVTALVSGFFRVARRDPAIEDYGLGRAFILSAVYNGASAALMGAVIVDVAQSGLTFASPGFRPSASPGLETLFSLQSNPFGLLGAAVFGLTPQLLTQRLDRAIQSFGSDLRRTSAIEPGHTALSETEQPVRYKD
jgi:hypothetical protein